MGEQSPNSTGIEQTFIGMQGNRVCGKSLTYGLNYSSIKKISVDHIIDFGI